MSLTAENITKKFGAQTALDDVSFSLQKGEITGFIGPNGAGKSTMMKIICGLLAPSTGRLMFNGSDIQQHSLEFRKILGYLPENNPLYPEMYIPEYLGFVYSLYPLPPGRKKAKVDEAVEMTGLRPEISKRIGQLSKGYRQRVGLAQALLNDPQVLILDEPTTGLDPNQIIEIRNLISEIGKEKTVMLSTHLMQEVEAICHKVIIIKSGKIVADKNTAMLGDEGKTEVQTIFAEFDQPVEAQLLTEKFQISHIRSVGNNSYLLEYKGNDDLRPLLFRFAVEHGITVLSLQRKDRSLEEIFHELTTK